MMRVVIAFLFGLTAFATTPASAFFFPQSEVVDEYLVAVNGRCFVRQEFADGTTSQHPCDRDAFLDDFDDDEWDEFCFYARQRLTRAEYEKYCGFPLASPSINFRFNDRLAFSDTSISVDPGYSMYTPYQQGFLETRDNMGNFFTPALNLDVHRSGLQFGIGYESELRFDRFMPLDVFGGFTVGYSNGSGSASNVQFPQGLGAPNTGNGTDIGGFSGLNTTLSTADLTIASTFASLEKGLGLPLAGGSFVLGDSLAGPSVNWDLMLRGGLRAGGFSERQTFTANAINGAASQINYDTEIMGGFVGGFVGLGLDKSIDLPNTDFDLVESFHLDVGLSHYMMRIDDSLSGSGPAGPGAASSNSYDASVTIPTFRAGLGLGLANDLFNIGLNTGITSGHNPPVVINRPISNVLNPAEVVLLSQIAWYASLSARFQLPAD